jgi:probable HAF family extracellular repeat protein
VKYLQSFTVLVILSTSSLTNAQTYQIVNLGTLGGHWSFPASLNDKGHVAGTSRLPSGASHSFFWSRTSGMQDLDPVIGDIRGASGINAADEVVGADSNAEHAFLWSPTTALQDLGTLGGCCSAAFAISDRSQVVGSSAAATGAEEAFSWTQAAGMQPLSTGRGKFSSTIAYAVNTEGFIVGAGNVVSYAFKQHALLWTPDGGVIDLGTLGGLDSTAQGINGSNQVVGWSLTTSGETHPFLWTSTTGMQDLGILAGFFSCSATAINRRGQVVGTCFPFVPTEVPHAFLWTTMMGMQDLNNLVCGNVNGTLGEALAINSRGQITVWAASNAHFTPSRALLLTPQ